VVLNDQIHSLSVLTPGRHVRTHWIGSSVSPIAVLDGSEEQKIIFPPGIRTPDRPARSQSLYDHAIPILLLLSILLLLLLLILFVVTFMQGIWYYARETNYVSTVYRYTVVTIYCACDDISHDKPFVLLILYYYYYYYYIILITCNNYIFLSYSVLLTIRNRASYNRTATLRYHPDAAFYIFFFQ
jgi:hypothetical protein